MHRNSTMITLFTTKILILIIVVGQFAYLLCGSFNIVNAEPGLNISSSSGFLTSIGYYIVVGEIENMGDSNLGNITLEATLYDADHNVVSSVNSRSTLSSLPPGRKSPFVIYLNNRTQALTVNSYEVLVASYQETAELEKSVTIVSYKCDNQSIYGVVENEGYLVANLVRVYATFYDENETAVDVSMSEVFLKMERATNEIYEIVYPPRDVSNKTIFQRAKWFSLTAESREYSAKEEIGLIRFALPEGPGDSSIFYIFAILIGISAGSLLVVFVIAESRERARRRRRLKRIKK